METREIISRTEKMLEAKNLRVEENYTSPIKNKTYKFAIVGKHGNCILTNNKSRKDLLVKYWCDTYYRNHER